MTVVRIGIDDIFIFYVSRFQLLLDFCCVAPKEPLWGTLVRSNP